MRYAALLALVVGCAQAPTEAIVDQAATVCGVGPTVKGIDVSVYQGTINWTAVKGAGVQYAFIRVSDGTTSPDSKFATNWAGSRAAGVYHGAYQFFRPGQDPIAQADLLLSKIGNQIAADDLPPVLDVEAADGKSPAQVAAAVKAWVQHVTAALGRPPIIYTGYYFWRDSVGGADDTSSPLWHAQYSSASCPQIADPWTTWAFWQYTSTGSVAGISGNVDVDRWNGDLASLQAFLGPPGTCGDGTCASNESKTSCPEDCGPCGDIADTGGVIDDSDACFTPGGPQAYMRHPTDAGEGGELYWTHTTSDPTESNFGQWDLFFDQGGLYHVEVYTAAKYAQSKKAAYVVHTAAAETSVTIDQSATDGWQALGDFQFADGGHQWIHLADNTGEPVADNVQIVFDAVRVTRLDGSGAGSAENPATDGPLKTAGCDAGGGGGVSWAVWMAASCAAFRRRSASRRR